jgi:hypothetical protein
MTVLQNGKRRVTGSEPLLRSFGNARTCAADGCTTQLSRYNPARCCSVHRGWDSEQATRPRRRRPALPVPPAPADDRPAA